MAPGYSTVRDGTIGTTAEGADKADWRGNTSHFEGWASRGVTRRELPRRATDWRQRDHVVSAASAFVGRIRGGSLAFFAKGATGFPR